LFSLQALAQCSNANLNGTYYYLFTGTITRTATPQGYVELGKLIADGNGGISGTSTASTAGTVANLTMTGTYTILADCSGTINLTVTNQLPVTLAIQLGNGGQVYTVSVSSTGEVVDGRMFRSASATGATCGNGTLNGAYAAPVNGFFNVQGTIQRITSAAQL